RDIVSTINGVHPKFNTQVYHPPSIEDQSRSMQIQEKNILIRRLILCLITSIPTLLIGVVWMSLVPATNSIRMYFETAVWSGTVTRAQWALCILATPIMFCGASVFHVRAIKEIRALWRPRSQVPILRRFYRFGSMNLLVSAGTSVAYFSSLALLIQGARTHPTTGEMNDKPQYFDAVVFLTTFILLGKFLEAWSKARTGNAVTMLGQLRPQEAVLVLPTTSSDKDQASSLLSPPHQVDPAVSISRTQTISVDLLEIGDVVVVPSGSSPPADGIMVKGSSRFNESSLTGEARDVPKNEGDQVFAGTVNTGNPVQVEIIGLGGTSMLDQIISVVREGQTKRAPVERIVDTVTAYFVPVITALAITTFLVWLALGLSGALDTKYIKNADGGWAFWSLEFAIAVFVVACPCGIGLAAPTALFVGGGLAAKSGILVRGGGEAFQEASNVDAVVFDKTGTLTEGGNPTVTDHEMLAEGDRATIAWSVTHCLEETSSHPLARAILHLASTQKGAGITASSVTEEAGRGLRGTFTIKTGGDGSNSTTIYEAAIGSEDFIASLQKGMVNYYNSMTLSTWKTQSKSVALLALRNIGDSPALASSNSSWSLAAMFAISDPLRPSAIHTVNALQSSGIAVYMLTGDNRSTASAVASTLSIPADHVFANCLPTQKAEKIQWLRENAPLRQPPSRWSVSKTIYGTMNLQRDAQDNKKPRRRAVVAFIGDGINDAPALASASVSIAISSHTGGSDIALSTSSFILLSSSLTTILVLLNLSRLVFRRIKYNFAWAVLYNAILIPVAAGVFFRVKEGGFKLSPAWGSAAMAGSSISVVTASLAMGWGWRRRVKGWERGWMKGYKKACDSLRSCPLTLTHPSETQALNGFGPKICERLEQRLKQHCEENGLPMPKRKSRKRVSDALDEAALDMTPAKKPRKSKKPYVPQLRSGAYALILGLSSIDESECVSRQQLVELAQPHCDSSFTATKDTTTFYTAWNSMKTLVDKDLVKETSRPQRRYALTDEGWEVAGKLKKVGKDVLDGGNIIHGRGRTVSPARDPSLVLRDSVPGDFEPITEKSSRRSRAPLANLSDQHNSRDSNIHGQRLGGAVTDKYGVLLSSKPSNSVGKDANAVPVAPKTPGKSHPTVDDDARLAARLQAKENNQPGEDNDDLDFIELLSSSPPGGSGVATQQKPSIHVNHSRAATTHSLPGISSEMHNGAFVPPSFQPIRLQPGAFTVELILDNREIRSREDRGYIEKELISKGIRPTVRALPLGDFFWVAKCTDPQFLTGHGEDGTEIALDYIIERKRLDDLISSIKDGRFHEQKFRLRKSGVKNVVYLLEDIAISQETKTKYYDAVQSAIASTQVVNGYFMKRTRGIDDTIRYLTRMTRTLKEMYEVSLPFST
ncbi:MAG: hypothetical protein Q9192_006553, partial [Flavoplaca navasiana]